LDPCGLPFCGTDSTYEFPGVKHETFELRASPMLFEILSKNKIRIHLTIKGGMLN